MTRRFVFDINKSALASSGATVFAVGRNEERGEALVKEAMRCRFEWKRPRRYENNE